MANNEKTKKNLSQPDQILEIVPLIHLQSWAPDSFTYFSFEKIGAGALVKISLNKKETFGYVLANQPLRKNLVKSLRFKLKPIIKVEANFFPLTKNQKDFAFWLSRFTNISLSQAFLLISAGLLKIKENLADFDSKTKNRNSEKIKTGFKKIFLAELDLNQIKTNPQPSLLIVPNKTYFDWAKKDSDFIVIDPSQPAKKFKTTLLKILNREKNIYLGTKTAIALPWLNLKTVAVIEEGSPFYKDNFKPPFFSYRELIEKFCQLNRLTLYLIADQPSLKAIAQTKIEPAKLEFKTFTNLTDLTNKIQNYRRSIIFAFSKKSALKIVCQNCFKSVDCFDCAWPMSLNENKLFCSLCFRTEPLPKICPNCGQPAYFSVKRFGGEWLRNYFDQLGQPTIFLKTKKDWQKIKKLKNYILIASFNLFAPTLPEVEAAFILDFDKAFKSTDIFIKEKFLRLAFQLKKFSKEIFLQLESNETNKKLEDRLQSGRIWSSLLEERKENFLPPFSRIIKITNRLVKLDQLNDRMVKLRNELESRKEKLFKNPEPRFFLSKEKIKTKTRIEIFGPFPGALPKKKNRHQLEIILKIDPNLNLKKFLEGIEAEIIEVDAEKI
ncbi:hypothetical protein M1525_01405 [Patescibacteria group bacterium]|nr:hypothetical protein [Patescibacteria group bacterium]